MALGFLASLSFMLLVSLCAMTMAHVYYNGPLRMQVKEVRVLRSETLRLQLDIMEQLREGFRMVSFSNGLPGGKVIAVYERVGV